MRRGGGSAAREKPADQAPAAPAAREPLSGRELRAAEGTRCEETHRQGLDPLSDDTGTGGIWGMSGESLSFNSWYALAEHRPRGGSNRLRKAVYEASFRQRRPPSVLSAMPPAP